MESEDGINGQTVTWRKRKRRQKVRRGHVAGVVKSAVHWGASLKYHHPAHSAVPLTPGLVQAQLAAPARRKEASDSDT